MNIDNMRRQRIRLTTQTDDTKLKLEARESDDNSIEAFLWRLRRLLEPPNDVLSDVGLTKISQLRAEMFTSAPIALETLKS